MRLSLLLLAISDSLAQSTCPGVQFKNVVSASLTPSLTTRLNLARQADGSYTSFETSLASPYSVLSGSLNFGKQLAACLPSQPAAINPAPAAPANPPGAASQGQAIALLSSGNYLVVGLNFVGDIGGVDAQVFDPQMNLLSVANYRVGGGGLALADLNGDGNPDLVSVGNGGMTTPGQLSILLGNGGSSFQAPIVYSISVPLVEVSSFAIGDLNGDHKPDIAVAVTPFGSNGSILTFLGNGDGTFQPGPTLVLTGEAGSVALADLNGDQKLDLVASSGNVAVALGNGDGSFAAPSYIEAAGGSVAIGDMNGDGKPDIVTVGTILFGDGKGSFPARQDYLVPSNLSASPVILTDLDGDGRTDIVIAGGTPALITGRYGSTINVLFGQPGGTWFAPAISLAPGLQVPNIFNSDLRAADFNGDGIPDIAYAGDYGVGVMLGKGDGTFSSSFATLTFESGGWYLATGDFNHDGNQDIVSLFPYPQAQETLTFFAGKGDGTFLPPLATNLPVGAAALVAGDFNGDGRLDLAILFSVENEAPADQVIIYLGNGDGSFRQGATYPAGPNASWILTGDLNNDRNLDLVISNSGSAAQTGNISTLLGKGDGTFVAATQSAPLAASISGDLGPSTMALADFNLDGRLDLAVSVANSSQTGQALAILLGNGDGTFQAPT